MGYENRNLKVSRKGSEGWFFCYNSVWVGPFKTLTEANELRVAAFLSGIPETKVHQLEALIKRATEHQWHGREDEATQLTDEYRDEIAGWPVKPKDVFKAKLREYALQEDPRPRRKRPEDYPVFPPSLMATCFKKRWRDVGDCDSAGCQYWPWCILQLKAISQGAVLLFYDKDPTKCSICHRRKAIHLFIVERGHHAPNSLYVTCNHCTAKTPQHWKILKEEKLERDY